MPKIDWSTTVMPFVEKYGKKFYDKFMELPDYIKGHMNPKEKETFIKEGKPSIKRYTMGDANVNASVASGRGRNPQDGGHYKGVYTATFPPSYGAGYGDYQFKVPFGHDEFRNKERIVTDPELPTVTALDELKDIRYDPERSKKHGKVKGPIKRREMQLDPSATVELDKTGLFMIPTGKRTPSGYNVTHTTEFGGRSDVFPGLDKDEIFLDSLATKSGRKLMRDARASEIHPGFRTMSQRLPYFYDGPVGNFVDGTTFWDRLNEESKAAGIAARNLIDNELQTKFKSVAGFTDAMLSDPSAMDRFVDETVPKLSDKLLEVGYESNPASANRTANVIIRKALDEYTSRISYFKNPTIWNTRKDALSRATPEKLKRISDDIKLLNELDDATHIKVDEDNNLIGSDRLRDLADRSLNQFGYVPEYITVYDDNLFGGYKRDIGGPIRFLLPQEPDVPIYRGQRIVDQPHKLEGQGNAHGRWISESFDNRDGKYRRIVKRPDDLLYAAAKYPQWRNDYYTASDLYQGQLDRELYDMSDFFDRYEQQLYNTAKSQLKQRGVTITDGIDRELKNLVKHRIGQYKDGTLKIPYPHYDNFMNEPVVDDLFLLEKR